MLNLLWAITDMSKGIVPFFIVFGGATPFIPQYLEIKRLQNSEGFSPYVCLALIISNLLRIGFWFGQPFPTPLLLQSILMVFTMMFMTYIWVKYRKLSPGAREHTIADLDWRYFWQWTDFASYVKFVILFAVVFGIPCFTYMSVYVFIQTVGFVALLTEAMLAVPQFVQNYRQSSTVGMSLEMVLLWAAGDFFKTIYFIVSASPIQFVTCGIIQLSVDFAIFMQYLYYRTKRGRTHFFA